MVVFSKSPNRGLTFPTRLRLVGDPVKKKKKKFSQRDNTELIKATGNSRKSNTDHSLILSDRKGIS
jgi:hypothetical protein